MEFHFWDCQKLNLCLLVTLFFSLSIPFLFQLYLGSFSHAPPDSTIPTHVVPYLITFLSPVYTIED